VLKRPYVAAGNWVFVGQFKRHLNYLLRKFTPLEHLRLPLPRDEFLITFDDALNGVYENAYPLMRERGLKGAIFVITDFIGRRNLWDATFGFPRRHMDKSAIVELSEAGWIIGSHTTSHRALTHLNDRELRRELEYSKKYLEDLIGRPVITLAYPFGLYDVRVVRMAERVGYRWGFAGPSLGGKFGSMNVPRIPVNLPDVFLGPKLWEACAPVDILLTLPSKLTPIYQRMRSLLLPKEGRVYEDGRGHD
ncbi:MAG: polysaccharide deacetylase family protein, partial [Thermotogae bacterium]|nr:polysaccharide deacetylase family protein [Thermotogota bacterium]